MGPVCGGLSRGASNWRARFPAGNGARRFEVPGIRTGRSRTPWDAAEGPPLFSLQDRGVPGGLPRAGSLSSVPRHIGGEGSCTRESRVPEGGPRGRMSAGRLGGQGLAPCAVACAYRGAAVSFLSFVLGCSFLCAPRWRARPFPLRGEDGVLVWMRVFLPGGAGGWWWDGSSPVCQWREGDICMEAEADVGG